MLDVVRLRQRIPADEVMHEDERRDFPAENRDQDGCDSERQCVALENFVVDRPDALALAREPLRLVAPTAQECAGQLAPRKTVNRFAETRARRVLGRGDPGVMAAIVLDAEMPVADDGVCQQREDLVRAIGLVAELMAERDATAVARADADRERNP